MATLRDMKKKKCEETIFRTAIELFNDQGYEQTTIRDIAEKAEVSVGTLYHYYKSKSDMLMSMLSAHRMSVELKADQYYQALEARDAAPVKAVSGLFHILFEAFLPLKKQLWRDILSVAYKNNDTLNGQLWALQHGFFVQTEKLVSYLQKRHRLNPVMDSRLAGDTLYSLFFVQFLRFINTDAEAWEIHHYLEKQLTLLLNGMEVK